MTNEFVGATEGTYNWTNLKKAIADALAEERSLRVAGQPHMADQLHHVVDELQAGAAQRAVAKTAREEGTLLAIHVEAGRGRKKALRSVACVGQKIYDAGLAAEVARVRQLVDTLKSSGAVAAELEDVMHGASDLAAQLKGMKKFWLASSLTHAAGNVAQAAQAKFDEEEKQAEQRAEENLKSAGRQSRTLAEELRSSGMQEEAVRAERIVSAVSSAEPIGVDRLAELIEDALAEERRLLALGQEQEAEEMHRVLVELEAASTDRLAAQGAKKRSELLAGETAAVGVIKELLRYANQTLTLTLGRALRVTDLFYV